MLTKLERNVGQFVINWLTDVSKDIQHAVSDDKSFDDVARILQRIHFTTGLLCTWAGTKNYMERPEEFLIDTEIMFDVMEENDNS